MLKKSFTLGLWFSVLLGCQSYDKAARLDYVEGSLKVAFLADIHFHNVYGKLQDNQYVGLSTQTPDGEKHALIRSMGAQLKSTRLFNETYFVLLAALDDLVKRKVKLVALPGDFSDDGQPLHLRGLASILKRYKEEHGMRFFAIPGNHDPVRPFTTASGKKDFLGDDGQEIAIYSLDDKRCAQGQTDGLVCANDLLKWGYKEIVATLADFGFYPNSKDKYFETPFTQANQKQFIFEERHFKWCETNNPTKCIAMPDTSYLVEPIDGLWLLAIDANVYQPKDDEHLSQKGKDFKGSSGAGYNALLQYKPELLNWIRDVVQRAKKQNKQLVAFSHFPMTDFYDAAQPEMEALFGRGKQQMARMPLLNTAKVLANTGLQLHVGGHMHINDTGSVVGEHNTLFNIQAPSLAAYRPGYKLLTLRDEIVDVETVVLDEVPRFDELFGHYKDEHTHLRRYSPSKLWNDKILAAANYGQFTDHHLKELVRLRYLPKEWPNDLLRYISENTFTGLFETTAVECTSFDVDAALSHANTLLKWKTTELFNDFYRLRNADSIAQVSLARQAFYMWFHKALNQCSFKEDSLQYKLSLMLEIMAKFSNAQPSDSIRLHLETGDIEELN
ncbi:metallophosphoesterase [Paraglaciecola sp.]|uniref:metallophosphoesterase family protein n=1 Tax=Paraglaciecola sp. TaxID=1920173 RepID=UPI003263B16C